MLLAALLSRRELCVENGSGWSKEARGGLGNGKSILPLLQYLRKRRKGFQEVSIGCTRNCQSRRNCHCHVYLLDAPLIQFLDFLYKGGPINRSTDAQFRLVVPTEPNPRESQDMEAQLEPKPAQPTCSQPGKSESIQMGAWFGRFYLHCIALACSMSVALPLLSKQNRNK